MAHQGVDALNVEQSLAVLRELKRIFSIYQTTFLYETMEQCIVKATEYFKEVEGEEWDENIRGPMQDDPYYPGAYNLIKVYY